MIFKNSRNSSNVCRLVPNHSYREQSTCEQLEKIKEYILTISVYVYMYIKITYHFVLVRVYSLDLVIYFFIKNGRFSDSNIINRD